MLMKAFVMKMIPISALTLRRDISLHLNRVLFRLRPTNNKRFLCNLCSYDGPFMDSGKPNNVFYRKHALCPRCGSFERQRLQFLVLNKLSIENDFSAMSMLHVAPEKALTKRFRKLFKVYHTGNVGARDRDIDYSIDLRWLPFRDATYDLVFASHVLEHIREDRQAISEITRILKPDGFAILPVPILATKTIEYHEPNPLEAGHVRAPGEDYYDRYRECFRKVEIFYSYDFPRHFQTYLYWNRNTFSNVDHVPVCYS
jgi:SAM-dependent methyltransferase